MSKSETVKRWMESQLRTLAAERRTNREDIYKLQQKLNSMTQDLAWQTEVITELENALGTTTEELWPGVEESPWERNFQ